MEYPRKSGHCYAHDVFNYIKELIDKYGVDFDFLSDTIPDNLDITEVYMKTLNELTDNTSDRIEGDIIMFC